MKDHREVAYLILRVTMGVVFLFYGVGKFMAGLGTFAAGLQGRFSEQLPGFIVVPFSYGLPIIEVALGLLLLVGLFNRIALAAAGVLMIALTFGAVMEPSPPTVANNVFFAFVIFVLLFLADHNRYSVDTKLEEK